MSQKKGKGYLSFANKLFPRDFQFICCDCKLYNDVV